MTEHDMDELLRQARLNDQAREKQTELDLAQYQVVLAEAIDARVATIRQLVSSWLDAMTSAGGPGVEVVREEASVARGLLRTKKMSQTREVPGWRVVSLPLSHDHYLDTDVYADLYVTADRRLVIQGVTGRPTEFDPQTEFTIQGRHVLSWPRTELVDALPEGLARTAAENGVDWTPDVTALPHVRAL